jgi:hypothetical protein
VTVTEVATATVCPNADPSVPHATVTEVTTAYVYLATDSSEPYPTLIIDPSVTYVTEIADPSVPYATETVTHLLGNGHTTTIIISYATATQTVSVFKTAHIPQVTAKSTHSVASRPSRATKTASRVSKTRISKASKTPNVSAH